jgi:SH3 domain protein
MHSNMKKTLYALLFLIMLGATTSLPIHAQEFAYVTDSLQLRVYASASADSELLQTLESGESVEMFTSEGGFTQVTTYDGTVGWVKSAFLVEDPPEKLLYFSVSEKNKELVAELERLKTELQSSSSSPSEDAPSADVDVLLTEVASLQESNQKLQQQLENSVSQTQAPSTSVASINHQQGLMQYLTKWWFGLVAFLLLIGFLFGLKYSSWRMKKRLHGFNF